MNTYQKCEECRGYINTVSTDHFIVKGEDGAEVYLHTVPCYKRYAEQNTHEVVDHVRTKYRSSR